MHRGNASPISSRKLGHGDSNKDKLGFIRKTERSDSASNPLPSVDSRISAETGASGKSWSHVIAPSTAYVKSKGRGRVSISQNRIVGQTNQARTGKNTIRASKRSKPRLLTNVTTLGDTSKWVQEVNVADNEVAPEKYDQAARSKQWRDSMLGERIALNNRGCWRVVRTPEGIILIKLKYVYKIKRDWTGKITKCKSTEAGSEL